ncbi:MAG: hypothetical protein ABL921_17005 [Pirellula sp.]
MARDRNVNVWQAYVIVMSIVSVACLGALILTVFVSGTNYKTAEAAIEKEKAAVESQRKAENAKQILQHIVGVKSLGDEGFSQLASGVSGDNELAAAISAYNANKSMFGQATGEQSYSKLIETLTRELRNRNLAVEQQAKEEIKMRDSYDKTIERETKAREAEQQNAQEFAKQLEKERTDYIAKVDAQQKLMTNLETEKAALVSLHNKKLGEATDNINKLTKENEDMKKRIDQLVRKLDEIQGQDFQYAQGRITQVTDGGETVYINLGKSHLLRPGVTFGVIDGDTTRVSEARPKARIEVVSIVSEDVARCKVLSDRAPTTILVHDVIYSPLWQPGKVVEIALVGKMDTDGDGKDDREVLKNLIRQAGGRVTADLTPAGKLEGALNEQTRFLVMGEDFKVRGKPLDALETDVAKKRNDLEAQARTLAITKINLDKLLGWIRSSNSNDVVPLGNGLRSKPSDYLPHNGSATANGRVSELYQSRDGKSKPSAP